MDLTILPKTTFDFGDLKKSGDGAEIFYAQNVVVVPFLETSLILRIHSATMPSGAEVTFTAYRSAPSVDDPSIVVRQTSTLFTQKLIPAETPPLMKAVLIASSTGTGATLDFAMMPSYVVGGGPFSATISALLVMKD